MINTNSNLTTKVLLPKIEKFFTLTEKKIQSINHSWDSEKGTPVFTVKGKYTSKGWTEWTQGFQFGCMILQYDATSDKTFLDMGRDKTIKYMAPHVSHIGVHDHGFNNVSTYGNLLRLIREERISSDNQGADFYELALKVSGAVQAARWTQISPELGYIHSFNGPQSLFADTMRSLRSLTVSYQLGHVLMGEQDQRVNLLERALQHAETTARYNVFYGGKRDLYDISGRVAHESIFNVKNGEYRCTNSQQGYSPFTTWTRGLAWILTGFAEQLEFLERLPEGSFERISKGLFDDKTAVLSRFLNIAKTVADFYLVNTPSDGIPYWDTGAPGLIRIKDYLTKSADPYNDFEPVDSSAAAIAAQGLLRLGRFLDKHGNSDQGNMYFQAGLTVASTLFDEPYLSTDPNHQGMLLHSIYHRPNNWDYIPQGSKIPRGESSMWGDYHAMELALMLLRMANDLPYYKFFLSSKS
jgi:unsaturated chondroitin disaccharide hydrolase